MVAKSPETTSQRLLEADKEQQNWITHHKTYNAQRFSTLDQINAGKVKGLKVAWTMQLGGLEGGGIWTHGGLEGTPIVEDGFMYVTDGWGSVYKIDTHGGKGTLLWKMDPKTDHDWAGAVACCGVDNRGVALFKDLGDLAYSGRTPRRDRQGDWSGQMAASGRRSRQGRSRHRRAAHREEHGDNGRGRRGIRHPRLDRRHGSRHSEGSVAHLHAPQEGRTRIRDLERNNSAETTGGGSTWVTGSYDPTTNTIVWGVGNPGPDWDNAYRPGDNLYTDSSLAVDADTGKIKWHFQHTPNDPYDYDSVAENVLVDVDGKKIALEADRNGFGYAVDRTDGKFLWATPFVKKVTWTKGIDPESGKPEEYDAKKQVQIYNPEATPVRSKEITDICPGNMGGKNWPPTAYNPVLKTWYVPVIESCNRITIKPERKRTSRATSSPAAARRSPSASRAASPRLTSRPARSSVSTRRPIRIWPVSSPLRISCSQANRQAKSTRLMQRPWSACGSSTRAAA